MTRWADAGAPEGDPKDAQPAVRWPDGGWQIKPDHIGQSLWARRSTVPLRRLLLAEA
jgi:hypothetical protein